MPGQVTDIHSFCKSYLGNNPITEEMMFVRTVLWQGTGLKGAWSTHTSLASALKKGCPEWNKKILFWSRPAALLRIDSISFCVFTRLKIGQRHCLERTIFFVCLHSLIYFLFVYFTTARALLKRDSPNTTWLHKVRRSCWKELFYLR